MKLERTDGDLTFYTRPTDPMQIANGQLSGETYRFYRNQFEGALLQTNNSDSSRAMLVHMRNLIGKGKLENPVGPVYSWTDQNLHVVYDRGAAAPDAAVIVGCIQVQARHQADVAAAQSSGTPH